MASVFPDFKFYTDLEGRKKWISHWGKRIYSYEQVEDDEFDNEGKPISKFGVVNQVTFTQGHPSSYDAQVVDGEELLIYCGDGSIKIYNISTNSTTIIPFKLKGMVCTKGGLEIINYEKDGVEKFSIITSVSYRALQAVVEIALPSPPKVKEVKLKTPSENNIVNDKKFSILVSGVDSNEPLKEYCVQYNSNITPVDSDSCWEEFSQTNKTEINGQIAEVTLGEIGGEYKLYVWFKDVDGQISGISQGGNGEEGKDVLTVKYEKSPPVQIKDLIATTSFTATSMNLANTRAQDADKFVVSWKMSGADELTEVNVEATSNGVDFSVWGKNQKALTTGCPDGFDGCFIKLKPTLPGEGETSFYVRVTVIQNGVVQHSISSPPLNSQALSFLGENDHGFKSAWSDFSVPLNYLYESEVTWNQLITQQFVVTSRGDILFNHPSKGIIQLDINSGLVDILIPKRFDSDVGDNGNNNRWSDAVVDDVGKISIDHLDNVYLRDGSQLRTFNIKDRFGLITNYSDITEPPGSLFVQDVNYAPFFPREDQSIYHLHKKDMNDLSFIYELNSGESIEKINITWNDVKTNIPSKGVNISDNSICGENSTVLDLNSCSP